MHRETFPTSPQDTSSSSISEHSRWKSHRKFFLYEVFMSTHYTSPRTHNTFPQLFTWKPLHFQKLMLLVYSPHIHLWMSLIFFSSIYPWPFLQFSFPPHFVFIFINNHLPYPYSYSSRLETLGCLSANVVPQALRQALTQFTSRIVNFRRT